MSVNLSGGGPLTAFPVSPTEDPSRLGGMTSPGTGGGFGDIFKSAMTQVNTLQDSAQQQVGALLQGGNVDMSKVMISVEKADVAFQLMMQVRNKIVTAYQDIEKMQF
jgi:flagellar hook-basal body complex protein FliE